MTHAATTLPTQMRTRIKICGITREQDLEAAVVAGADAIGFVLYPKSPRYVSPQRAAAVLLFVNASLADILAASRLVPGAALQFHGDESPEDCLQAATAANCPYLRAARIPLGDGAAQFDLVKYALDFSNARAILLDAHVDGYGGGGKVFNWSLLPPSVNAQLVLSGGLDSANVGDGIATLRPRCLSLGVDISSGVEATDAQGLPLRGIKDRNKINQFVAAVRAADKRLAGIS
jgi:phosphoribosylanthranilate isomerase